MRYKPVTLLLLIVLTTQLACYRGAGLNVPVAVAKAPVSTLVPTITIPTTVSQVVEPTVPPTQAPPTQEPQTVVLEPTLSVQTSVLKEGFAEVKLPVEQWLTRKWESTDNPTVVVPEPQPETVDVPAFTETVNTGQSGVITGISVPGKFQFKVHQQPIGDENFVGTTAGEVTQYQTPGHFGVKSFLAHNTENMGGLSFYLVTHGDEVILVYGDGRTETYEVKNIVTVSAESPYDPYSNFILENGNPPDNRHAVGARMTYADVFNWFYTISGTLVLQTCVEGQMQDGQWNLSWGRVFIIAYPKG